MDRRCQHGVDVMEWGDWKDWLIGAASVALVLLIFVMIATWFFVVLLSIRDILVAGRVQSVCEILRLSADL